MWRVLLYAGGLLALGTLAFPGEPKGFWQGVSNAIAAPLRAQGALREAAPEAAALIRAAEAQVGVTTVYDPAYVQLDFPGGDVPPERGVCTDVLIRAFREGHGIDLQLAVNADMKRNFSKYPANWGLKSTDRNIDHRRVPNLARLFQRMGAELPLAAEPELDPEAFKPGDIVTSMLPGNLPHVMIVTERMGAKGPMVVHNIGSGTRIEDALFAYPLTGHYRPGPEVLARLAALGT